MSGRYHISLKKLKDFGDSLPHDEMQEALYGLTNSIPDLWKNPKYIGSGGNAVVVKAYSDLLQKDCAIKFCFPILTKELRKKYFFDAINKIVNKDKMAMKTEYEARFKRGVQIQETLHSIAQKNNLFAYGLIPEVLTYPNHNEMLHFSMQYIEAQNLISWCEKNNDSDILHLYRKILVFINLCMHKFGYVHSDLKPDNILVTETMLPVIIDFGISKQITNKEHDLTHEASILGAPKWMSEEQSSVSKYRTRKDDIYTLGLTFWSMLTREIPQIPIGMNLEDIKIEKLFPDYRIPSHLEEFKDFFLKAVAPSKNRYPDLNVAIESFDRTYNFWYKRHNTIQNINTTIISQSFKNIDWDNAKQGIQNENLVEPLKKIVKGLELLFFEGKNK